VAGVRYNLNRFAFTSYWAIVRNRTIIPASKYRYLAQTVYFIPLILGLTAACLFAFVPQMKEIYLGLIVDQDFWRGLAGLAALSLFSALLYAWNFMEVKRRIDAIYDDHRDFDFDRRLMYVRDLKTAFASGLPFLGILTGLISVYGHVQEAQTLAKTAALQGELLKALPHLPQAVLTAAGITAVFYLSLGFLLYRLRRKPDNIPRLVHFCYALTVLLILGPALFSDTALWASRLWGPLAGTAFVLIGATVLLRLVYKTAWLVLALPSAALLAVANPPMVVRQLAVALMPLALITTYGVHTILSASDSPQAQPDAAGKAGADDLASKFDSWLAERKTGQGRYTVFIVAAQGGGIYAASTAGAFLATMQDHCPAFAKHIFAISAVSGGSVGASLFNAAFAESIARGTNRKAAVDVEPGCDADFSHPGELSKRLQKITQGDHISPVLAYLLPDLVKEFVYDPISGWFEGPAKRGLPSKAFRHAWLGRDQVLAKSFVDSFNRSSLPGGSTRSSDCPQTNDGNILTRAFSSGWSPSCDIPALILNSTSAETGYRVAFSPFDLKPLGGGTLYSFSNLKSERTNEPPDPSLIEAAVISARFPVIMPSWSLDLGNYSLTFVDGGYADSSGAATALQLYKQLEELRGGSIDLYLITLTDKLNSLAPIGIAPSGSLPAPVTTLLSVRDLQSRKAVTEARSSLHDRMIVVQLDQKAFPLPLGWQLSRLSAGVISLTIGDPAACKNPDGDIGETTISIAKRNSCELRKISNLLAPKTHSSETLFEQPAVPKTFGRWELSPQ